MPATTSGYIQVLGVEAATLCDLGNTRPLACALVASSQVVLVRQQKAHRQDLPVRSSRGVPSLKLRKRPHAVEEGSENGHGLKFGSRIGSPL